jgi:hypothetical protein
MYETANLNSTFISISIEKNFLKLILKSTYEICIYKRGIMYVCMHPIDAQTANGI